MKKFILGLSILAFSSGYAESFKVESEKYRKWNHVKSMIIFEKKHPLYNPFNGIHHVYVNEKGLKTIKTQGKRTFPDGTVIAIVFYEQVDTGNGAYVEGMKRIEAFMVKNTKKFKETNGWGYFGYDGNGNNLVKNMSTDCHLCHGQVKDSDYVFSNWTK